VRTETTLASLSQEHPASVLCVYDWDRERDGAGIEHLDLAVARHPDGLQEQRLGLRRTADTLYVDGEIDMSKLDVFATTLGALTDTPSLTVHIQLEGVTFLAAAAAARTVIRDTAPYRDHGADVEIHATPHTARVLQLLDIHRLPNLHGTAEWCARTGCNDRRDRYWRARRRTDDDREPHLHPFRRLLCRAVDRTSIGIPTVIGLLRTDSRHAC
jgi:hypothetical protein